MRVSCEIGKLLWNTPLMSQQEREQEVSLLNISQLDFIRIQESLDRNKLVYPVKYLFEICDYNLKCFMPLGRMIDEIITEASMNAAHK